MHGARRHARTHARRLVVDVGMVVWKKPHALSPSLSHRPLLLERSGVREEREEACVHATSPRRRRRRLQTPRNPLHIITEIDECREDDVDVPAIVAVAFDDDNDTYHQRETDVARNGMVRGVGVGIIQ